MTHRRDRMSDSTVEMEALKNAPFFAGLSPADLDGILRVGRSVSFEPGQPIVEQGDIGDGMYVIVSGTAEVDVGGRFHKLTTGNFFGEMALVSAGKRMATVTAVDPVEALKIPADGFQSFLQDHPGVAVSMLRAVVDRLREVEQRIDAWMTS
jgi:cAMP-binding proteins - catabolite gene activator and regulatory subunit of cAMP-dependent protein kinases